MGMGNLTALKVESFVELVKDLCPWQNCCSKAWLVRETLTLLHGSSTLTVVAATQPGTLDRVAYENANVTPDGGDGGHDANRDGGGSGRVKVFQSTTREGAFFQTRNRDKN